MRKIKFRAWDSVTKEMIYDANSDIKIYLNGFINQRGSWADPEVIALQYTGLKDKNGKEIYEGDLIKEITDFARTYQAKWFDNGWSLSIEPYHDRHFRDAQHMEIIGNIYENPDLLKEDSKEAQAKG